MFKINPTKIQFSNQNTHLNRAAIVLLQKSMCLAAKGWFARWAGKLLLCGVGFPRGTIPIFFSILARCFFLGCLRTTVSIRNVSDFEALTCQVALSQICD